MPQQDFEGALSGWLALYGQSAPNAAWAPTVRRDIINMARLLRRPLNEILIDASADEIAFAASPPPEQTSPVERIAEIEAELADKPKNFELSIELAGLYAAAGQADKAAAALDAARTQYPGAPFVEKRLADTARELGVAPRREPTDADVAAATTMSATERNDMVRGMVAGLASRLESEPDDLDGWLMLIRSYAVLQDADGAKLAVQSAYSHFEGRSDQRDAIRTIALEFGISLF